MNPHHPQKTEAEMDGAPSLCPEINRGPPILSPQRDDGYGDRVKAVHHGPPILSPQRECDVIGDHNYRGAGKQAYHMLDHSPDWKESPGALVDHHSYGMPRPEDSACPGKRQKLRTREEEKAKLQAKKRLFVKELRKSKVSQAVSILIKTQKRRMLAQKLRRRQRKNALDPGSRTGGADDVAVAFEPSNTETPNPIPLALLDHSCMALPTDPAQLSLRVRGLAQCKHHYHTAIRGLQRYIEFAEQQLKDLREEMEERDDDTHTKLMELVGQLKRHQRANELLRKELQETKEKLQASSNTVLFLSTNMEQQRKPQEERLTAALTAQVLSRAPGKWLRFFTGFSSYARFRAFLSFLQSGDGAMLVKSRPAQGEQEDGERNGGGEENGEEAGPTSNIATHQEKDSSAPTTEQASDFCPDYSEAEEDQLEASARSVRQRILAELRGSKSVPSNHRLLGPEDQLLLTLTRLRLGLLLQDLAFRFNVSEATASRIWLHWIGVMQRRLQQIPVRCSSHYIKQFQPQRAVSLADGRELAVLECTDLLFEATKCRSRSKKRGSQPYRYLNVHRGCTLASPEGHLGFCSSNRLEELEEWLEGSDKPSPATRPKLPAYLVGDDAGTVPVPAQGTPCLEVLSIRSLTDKVLTFRYLRGIQSQVGGSVVHMDNAWEVCCYLSCLLYRPMGLK